MSNNSKRNTASRRRFIRTAGTAGTAMVLAGCSSSDKGNSNKEGGNTDNSDNSKGGSQPASLTVGAAPSGSTMYNTWQGILRAVEESDSSVNLTIQETPGGEANLRLYDRGEIDIGGGSRHDINQVMSGSGPYKENPVGKLALQAFRYAVMHLYVVAVDGSGVETFDDLRNDDIVTWPISPGTSVRAFTKHLWSQTGLWDDINRADISPADIAGAVEEGRVDALVVYGSGFEYLPDYYRQVDARADVHTIGMPDDLKSTIQNENAHLELDPYGWEQDLATTDGWQLDYQVGFGDKSHVSREAGYELVKTIANNIDKVQSAQSAFPSSPEDMTKAIISDERLPVHPGVADAYKELGVFDDSWTVGWNTDY